MEKIKNFLKPFGFILAYFGMQILLQSIFLSFGIKDENMTIVAAILIELIATGFVVFLLRHKLKGKLADFKKNHKKYIGTALQWWILGLIFMVVSNLIVMSLLGGIAPNEEANREIISNMLPYAIVSICICAPIAEELIFRQGFRDTFKSKTSFLIFTSLFFGSMHIIGTYTGLSDFLYVIPYSILGYAFGKAYVETDNIISSIFIHMLQNTMAVMMIVFGI